MLHRRSPGMRSSRCGGIVLMYAVCARIRQVGAGAARLVDQLLEDEVRAFRPLDLEHGVEGVDPFAGFEGIDVLQAVHGSSSGLRGEGALDAAQGMAVTPLDRIV